MESITIKYDEPIQDKYNYHEQIDYDRAKIIEVGTSSYESFYYTNNKGNCKVCTIMNLQSALEMNFIKTVERLKELFDSVSKLVFNCTFNDLNIINRLSKHFDLVYKVVVPIGYGNGSQYHCSFVTSGYYYDKDRYVERIKKKNNE